MRKKCKFILILTLLMVTLCQAVAFADEDFSGDLDFDAVSIAELDQERGEARTKYYESVGVDTASDFEEVKTAKNTKEKIDKSKIYYSFAIMPSSGFIKVGIGDALNGLTNGIFSLSKAWMGFAASSVQSLLNYDILDKHADSVQSLLKNVTKIKGITASSGGLSYFIWLGAAFTFALAILAFARGQISGAFSKLFQLVLILALLMGYVSMPNYLMKPLQSFTSSAGTSIIAEGGDSASDAAMKKIWKVGIDYPWQQLEFGKVRKSEGMLEVTEGEEYEWWSTKPDKRPYINTDYKDQEDYYSHIEKKNGELEESAEDSVKPPYAWLDKAGTVHNDFGTQGGRLGEAFFVMIVNFILGGVLIIVAGIGIGFQLGAIIMWFVGFFVLILALFPTHGTSKIKEWGGALAMCYFGQMIIAVALMLTLNVLSWFFDEASNIYKVYILMIGLGIAIKLMAKPLGGLLGAGAGAAVLSAGGGIMRGTRNAGSAAWGRVTGRGYRGDSTQRLAPNPIRQNREAKRMAQRQERQEQYQEKLDKKKEAKLKKAQDKAEKKQSNRRAVAKAKAGVGAEHAKAKGRDAKNAVHNSKPMKSLRQSSEKARANREQAIRNAERRQEEIRKGRKIRTPDIAEGKQSYSLGKNADGTAKKPKELKQEKTASPEKVKQARSGELHRQRSGTRAQNEGMRSSRQATVKRQAEKTNQPKAAVTNRPKTSNGHGKGGSGNSGK